MSNQTVNTSLEKNYITPLLNPPHSPRKRTILPRTPPHSNLHPNFDYYNHCNVTTNVTMSQRCYFKGYWITKIQMCTSLVLVSLLILLMLGPHSNFLSRVNPQHITQRKNLKRISPFWERYFFLPSSLFIHGCPLLSTPGWSYSVRVTASPVWGLVATAVCENPLQTVVG